MVKPVTSKLKQTIFGIAIALLLVFFVAYATSTLYPSPDYNSYCDYSKPVTATTQESCEALNGTWNENVPKVENQTGYCDMYRQCSQAYEDAREPYERTVFLINLLLGLAILITAFFLKVEVVSAGLMGGGAILMVYGTLRYWSELSNILRTVFLGIALAIVVWFGWKKFG